MNFQKGIIYVALSTLCMSHVAIHTVSAAEEEPSYNDAIIEEIVEIDETTTEELYVEEAVFIDDTSAPAVEDTLQEEPSSSPVIEEAVDMSPPTDAPVYVDEALFTNETVEALFPIEVQQPPVLLTPPVEEELAAEPAPQYITTNATYMDALTEQQAMHTYTFNVTGKTKVTWQYKHVAQAQWHHTLYNATDEVIGTKTINSSSYGLFTTYEKILTPGTYYMTITGNDVAMNEHYTFTLTEVLPKMFTDVDNDHPYRDEIGAIQQMGIVTGFENDTFEPDTFIQRKHIAAMIMRAEANVRLLSTPQNFVDVPYGHPYYQDIMGLYRSNIIDGKLLAEGTYFEPDAQITRAQLAKILVNAFTISPADSTSYYVDVTADNWFYDAANTLASHSIFFDNTNTFNGDTFVTRAEFAHLLYRAMHVAHE